MEDYFVKFVIYCNNLPQEIFSDRFDIWIEALSFVVRDEIHGILFLYPYSNRPGLCGVVSSTFLAHICLRHILMGDCSR